MAAVARMVGPLTILSAWSASAEILTRPGLEGSEPPATVASPPGVAARPCMPLLVSTWTATVGLDCSGTGRPPANTSTASGGKTLRVTVGAGIAASVLGGASFVAGTLCLSCGVFAPLDFGVGKSVPTGATAAGVGVSLTGGAPVVVGAVAGGGAGSVCTASVSG